MRLNFLHVLLALVLAGCKVGPEYVPPTVLMPDEYVESTPEETFIIEDADLLHWWSRFNDPFLDSLIDIALTNNLDYRIAIEKVYQARAQYWIQFTQILPEIDGTLVMSRSRTSQSFVGSPIPPPLNPIDNFFLVGLDAIWELDFWGQYWHAADAAFDIWEATDAQAWGVKLTVISEVAVTYTTICSFQQLKNIQEQLIEMDEEILSLAVTRFDAGLGDEQDVDAAQAALDADKAQLTVLDAALKQYIYSLAVLLGVYPESLIDDFLIARPIPFAEGKVPNDIPSRLLRRRPDIVSAERELAAATEEVGVAIAQLFPSIALTGSSSSFAANPLQGANVGYSSDRLNQWVQHKSLIWGIGFFVQAPLLDFGKRCANVQVEVTLENQAYYTYMNTVLSAIQEVETTLEVFFNEEEREIDLSKQTVAYARILDLTTDLFEAGLADYTQVVEAKETWLNSLTTLTQSQQNLTTDLIAIYKALGGNW